MAEEFVGSVELTVTVLKDKPLCVTEIKAGQNEDFYKFLDDRFEKLLMLDNMRTL